MQTYTHLQQWEWKDYTEGLLTWSGYILLLLFELFFKKKQISITYLGMFF